ncbi:MAG: hypothetical protein ACM3SM_03590 [Bacteroidota bacterium]
MNEAIKYDSIIEELNSLEQQALTVSGTIRGLHERIAELERINSELSSTNSELNLKIIELDDKIDALRKEKEFLSKSSMYSNKERENLKLQINDLISRIDHHLRS